MVMVDVADNQINEEGMLVIFNAGENLKKMQRLSLGKIIMLI